MWENLHSIQWEKTLTLDHDMGATAPGEEDPTHLDDTLGGALQLKWRFLIAGPQTVTRRQKEKSNLHQPLTSNDMYP